MNQSYATHERIVHRIKIARGHLDTVVTMVENGQYCVDIITQSRAVQHALREIDHLLLKSHLETCVVDLVKSGKERQSVDEIMTLFKNNGR